MRLADLTLTPSGYRPGGFSTRICRVSGQGQDAFGLFKEYDRDKSRMLDVTSLETLIRWRHDLPHPDRKYVDSFCAFPRAIVRDGDVVVGILMNEAPSAFLQQHHRQGAQPRQAEVLGQRHARAARTGGQYFGPPHKLALLGVLLQRLIWLHDQHVVVGDLHPRNVLVTASADIREVYLLDCDSFWLGDLHAFPPHAPDMWRVAGQYLTPATDLKKFAWLVVRTVCEDFSIFDEFPDEQLHEMLPGQHVRQLQRMWSADPSLASERLRSMANSWTNLVKTSAGRPAAMYLWTDRSGRVRWYPADPANQEAGTAPGSASRTTFTDPQPNRRASSAPAPAPPRHGPRKQVTVLMIVMMIAAVALIAWIGWLRP